MIETEDYKAVYDCDGVTTRFDFTFQITEEDDLDVKRYNSVGLVEATLILGSDYTMEQATVGTWLDGGTVVTSTAYITNDRISLTRDVPSTQLLDYVENNPFPAESHEGGLDKLTVIALQLEEILSRVMTIPKSDPVGIDNELAPLEARLGRYIQFDPVTGEPNLVQAVSGTAVTTAWSEEWLLNNSSSDGLDQLGFSAFVKTLIADADASARLTQLGFSAFAETLIGDADASARLTQLGFSAYVETIIGAADANAFNALTGAVGADNDIINGALNVWQRGASFPAITTTSYFADRFQYTRVGAMVFTISQDSDVPGTTPFDVNYSMKIDCTTVDVSLAVGDYALVRQPMEGYDFKKYVGGYGTLSFWVKATKTGVYCVSFRNSGIDRSYVAEYTVNATATWEYKTITIPFDYSGGTWAYTSGVGIYIGWVLAAGSDWEVAAPDTWEAGNLISTSNQVNGCDNVANDFFLSKMRFELGQVATPFIVPNITDDIAKCERFFSKSYGVGTTPGANTVNGAIYSRYSAAVGNRPGNARFPVRMKGNPTVNLYSLAGTLNRVSECDGGFTHVGNLTLDTGAESIGQTGFGGVDLSGTSDSMLGYHYTADIEF